MNTLFLVGWIFLGAAIAVFILAALEVMRRPRR
jgi:hypothetical protein